MLGSLALRPDVQSFVDDAMPGSAPPSDCGQATGRRNIFHVKQTRHNEEGTDAYSSIYSNCRYICIIFRS